MTEFQLTANLAVGLAQKNMKVLIVDADPQSDVSAGFGYRDCDDSNETLTALMDAVMKDEDIPSECFIRHQAEGIDIICSNIGLAGTEVQLVNAMSREYVCECDITDWKRQTKIFLRTRFGCQIFFTESKRASGNKSPRSK